MLQLAQRRLGPVEVLLAACLDLSGRAVCSDAGALFGPLPPVEHLPSPQSAFPKRFVVTLDRVPRDGVG